MAELTADEYNFIVRYFLAYKQEIKGNHSISEIQEYFEEESFSGSSARYHIDSLNRKNIVDISPNQRQLKFTTYGIELLREFHGRQEAWENEEPFKKLSLVSNPQTVIRAGEKFKADKMVREIIGRADKEIEVLDPYIGSQIFDQIEDLNRKIKIKIITVEKNLKSAVAASYKAYKAQYQNAELYSLPQGADTIHDRYILVDRHEAFHIGHSLKNLGEKDTQINRVADLAKCISAFDSHYKKANLIP